MSNTLFLFGDFVLLNSFLLEKIFTHTRRYYRMIDSRQ